MDSGDLRCIAPLATQFMGSPVACMTLIEQENVSRCPNWRRHANAVSNATEQPNHFVSALEDVRARRVKRCKAEDNGAVCGSLLTADGLCANAGDHPTVHTTPGPLSVSEQSIFNWCKIADYYGIPLNAGPSSVKDWIRGRGHYMDLNVARIVSRARQRPGYRP